MDEILKRAKQYSRSRYYLSSLEIIVYLCFFILLYFSGASLYIKELLYGISKSSYILVTLYVILVNLLLNIITLPLDFLSSFKLEHRFGLSRQSLSSWYKDYVKTVIIGTILYVILINILYYFLRASGTFWWLYTALLYFFISVVLARVFPVIIIPLFYKMARLSDDSLKKRLLSLAAKAGVKILDVYKIALGEKTKKANAAVCGLGSTKRILLSDTLLQEYTQDEIEAALAHELAHHKHQHFWKLSLYNFVFTLLGFALINGISQAAVVLQRIEKISDITAFPVLAVLFIIYNTLTLPVLNFISRRYETEADRESIRLTNKPSAFANLIKKLSMQNLSDPSPGFLIKIFFYDHPPAAERIKTAGGKIYV